MASHFFDTSCHFPPVAEDRFGKDLIEPDEKPLAPIRGLVFAVLCEGALALSAIAIWGIWHMLR